MLQEEFIEEIFSIDVANAKKIDIVYTFVDPNDKEWRKKYLTYTKRLCKGRYDDTHIIFSLCSLIKYAEPIINNIYIVSDKQKINFDDLGKYAYFKNKIVHIDHEEIIPKIYLPTFNSMTIEAFLWNIKDIKQNFLYLNDDFVIGNYLSYNDFFCKNTNKMIQFYYTKSNQAKTRWGKNIENSNMLFNTKFNTSYSLFPQHAPYLIQKPLYQNLFNIFFNDLEGMFIKNKTRQYDSISHNLIYIHAIYTHYKNVAINKRTSFKHIFSFNDFLINETKSHSNRKKFYAISCNNYHEETFQKFKQNILS